MSELAGNNELAVPRVCEEAKQGQPRFIHVLKSKVGQKKDKPCSAPVADFQGEVLDSELRSFAQQGLTGPVGAHLLQGISPMTNLILKVTAQLLRSF